MIAMIRHADDRPLHVVTLTAPGAVGMFGVVDAEIDAVREWLRAGGWTIQEEDAGHSARS